MPTHRTLMIIALCCAWFLPVGCKKKKPPPPKELASLTPDKACKHFFGRVKTCAPSINRIKADKLGLKGAQREKFLRQLNQRLRQTFSNLDLLCEQYAIKARKQQTDMDKCYRERTCDGFAQCFAKMADADVAGMGGNRARTLEELRKRLKQLKNLPGMPPGPMGHGHDHGPGPMTKPRSRP